MYMYTADFLLVYVLISTSKRDEGASSMWSMGREPRAETQERAGRELRERAVRTAMRKRQSGKSGRQRENVWRSRRRHQEEEAAEEIQGGREEPEAFSRSSDKRTKGSARTKMHGAGPRCRVVRYCPSGCESELECVAFLTYKQAN